MNETNPLTMTAAKKVAPARKAAGRKAAGRKASPAGPPVVDDRGPERVQPPAPVKAAAQLPIASRPECNVPGCRAEPKTRGLCDPHWATHRGYASPSTKRTESDR